VQNRQRRLLFLVGALLFAAGCASGGGGPGIQDPSLFRRDMGRATYLDIREGVDKILTKYGFNVWRFQENFSSLYFETDWLMREPYPEERDLGVERARSRIILEGRRSGDLFRLRFSAENEVWLRGEWQRIALNDQWRKKLQRLVSDLEMEIRSGVQKR